MKNIVIIGAGGHARVIAEAIALSGDSRVAGFLDDHIEKGTFVIDQIPVIGSSSDIQLISGQCDAFVIGIGSNEVRKQLADQHSERIRFATVIHPRASVSPTASVRPGTVILAGAVVGANAKIAGHCIINSNVVVDHDCVVGDFTHLAIGTLVGSNSVVSSMLKTVIGQAIPAFSNI